MKKIKINRSIAIKSILNDLKKGIDKKSILENLRKKSNFHISSFYNWYKEAEQQYLSFKTKANPVIEAKEMELLSSLAEQNIKNGILTKTQVLKRLSDLVLYAKRDSDKINAAKTMAEWEGWKAPIKTDITSLGESLNKPMTREEAKKFLDDLKNDI